MIVNTRVKKMREFANISKCTTVIIAGLKSSPFVETNKRKDVNKSCADYTNDNRRNEIRPRHFCFFQ